MERPNQRGFFKRRLGTQGMGAAIAAFGGLIVIYLAFGFLNATVFSLENGRNLLRGMSKYLLVSMGQSYVLITGNIDLSIGSVVGMSAMISATLMTAGVPVALAILITLACCLTVGLVNGILVAKFQLPPFIATLGTLFVARGVAYMVNGNRNTGSIASGIGREAGNAFQDFFYYGETMFIYHTVWIAFGLFLVLFFLLNKTRTGRHLYAIGSNLEAAKLSGVNAVETITKAYIISAFCSFVVGLILCAQAGMGNMEAGNMYEMYGVAAGVMGGVSPMGGTGQLLGTLAGSAVWQVLENGLSMISAPVGIQRIVIGFTVVFSVLLDVVVRKGASIKRVFASFSCLFLSVGFLVSCSAKNMGVNATSAAGGVKIALITMDCIDQHWIMLNEGAQKAARERNVTVTFMSPNTKDDAQQIECVNNAVAGGYLAILVAANDPDAISTVLSKAAGKGVKIIYVDSPANADAIATYATDNQAAGTIAGRQMIRALEGMGVTSGCVGIVNVNQATASCRAREEGFRAAFVDKGYTLLHTQYGEGDAAKSQGIAENFITQGVVGMFGCNEGSTTGIGNAIKASGTSRIIGVGFDRSDAIINLIKDGYLLCTVAQNPDIMGYEGVMAAVDALDGVNLGETITDTGTFVLRKSNLSIKI